MPSTIPGTEQTAVNKEVSCPQGAYLQVEGSRCSPAEYVLCQLVMSSEEKREPVRGQGMQGGWVAV